MVGTVIGNYQIVRQLGKGGMGAVYLGQHTLLGRRAAIKVLLPALSARPDIVNRFFNEARAVTSISDPGIVQVFDFGYHSDGSAFIVMEYLDGEPLDHRLKRLGMLPVTEALRLCRQLAGSLAAAHAQHIIHRDLKPENIFLVHDAEVASGERPKILDFGIAKLSDEHPSKFKTHTGMVMGTPMYMSPEQGRGLAGIDHRSDIYSLGCVLFHLLTGEPPFDGEGVGDIISAHIREPAPAPSSRAPEVSPTVDAIVLRCLAKRPADRFQTMSELAAAISPLLQLQQASASGSVNAVPASSLFLPASGPATTAPTVQLAGTSRTSITREPSSDQLASVTSTTLRGSQGEIETLPPPPRQIGPWIAGLVVSAAMVAIVIAVIGMRDPTSGHDAGLVASGSAVPMGSGASPGSAGDASGITQDAGLPDAREVSPTGVIDAGRGEPPPPVGPVPTPKKLTVNCTIEAHTESHPELDAGAKLKMHCIVKNIGKAATGMVDLNVSIGGKVLAHMQTKSIAAAGFAAPDVSITIPPELPTNTSAEISIIVLDPLHSWSDNAKLPVTVRNVKE